MRNLGMTFICIIALVAGQILVKCGLLQIGGFTFGFSDFKTQILKIISCPFIWAGLIITALSALLWFDVLSRVKFSIAYPMLSLCYVLALFAAWLIFKENVPWIRWIGVFVICIGVYLVSRA